MPTINFTREDAQRMAELLNVDLWTFSLDEFQKGMNHELEHGLINPVTNITNDNDLLTAKIALAHLQDMPDYYTRLEQIEQQAKGLSPDKTHYYGDLIRRYFMIAAIAMLISLPFVYQYLPFSLLAGVLSVLLLGLFAGLTSPVQPWVIKIDAVIAVIGFVLSEVFAIRSYLNNLPLFFVVNQALALLFLGALYYNVKTIRGMIIKK